MTAAIEGVPPEFRSQFARQLYRTAKWIAADKRVVQYDNVLEAFRYLTSLEQYATVCGKQPFANDLERARAIALLIREVTFLSGADPEVVHQMGEIGHALRQWHALPSDVQTDVSEVVRHKLNMPSRLSRLYDRVVDLIRTLREKIGDLHCSSEDREKVLQAVNTFEENTRLLPGESFQAYSARLQESFHVLNDQLTNPSLSRYCKNFYNDLLRIGKARVEVQGRRANIIQDFEQRYSNPGRKAITNEEFVRDVENAIRYKDELSQAALGTLMEEGERRAEVLFNNGLFLKFQEFSDKLFQISKPSINLKEMYYCSLFQSLNPDEGAKYGLTLLQDKDIPLDTKIRYGLNGFQSLARSGRFDEAQAFCSEVIAIMSGMPLTEEVAAALRKLQEDRTALLQKKMRFSEAHNLTMSPPSQRIKGLTERQAQIIEQLAEHEPGTAYPQQLREGCHDLYDFCFGNSEFSKACSKALKQKGLDERVRGVLRELAILSYKTQKGNIVAYLRASEKLETIRQKLQIRQKLADHASLGVELHQPEEVLLTLHSAEELRDMRLRYAEEETCLAGENPTILPDERLTRGDITALNSIIHLKYVLFEMIDMPQRQPVPQEGYINVTMDERGAVTGNPLFCLLIEREREAEVRTTELMNTLGEPYQTGDLTFRNTEKFGSLTHKKAPVHMRAYEVMVTHLGHAGLVDRTRDTDELYLSEVLGEYVNRPFPLEDFFSTDIYRFNVSTLLSDEGRAIISRYVEGLKREGKIPEQMGVDEYMQQMFGSKIREVLAGPEDADIEEYHRQTFGSIVNPGSAQIMAGVRDILNPLQVGQQSLGEHLGEIEFQGTMVCSQFQGLAIIKALALTQTELYGNMVDQLQEEGAEPESSRESSVTRLKHDKPSLFNLRHFERQSATSLTPRKIASLFEHHLVPVPMAPIAREMLNLPPRMFQTVLFH